MEAKCNSIEELKKQAEIIVEKLKKEQNNKGVLLTISGELGAGKTTFAQIVGSLLGVSVNMQSPTYTICRKYNIESGHFKAIYHIDAYRLESGKELDDINFRDMLESPRTLILLEWPENVIESLPNDRIEVSILCENEKTRKFIYEKR